MPIDKKSDGAGGSWSTRARAGLAAVVFSIGGIAFLTLRSDGNYYETTDFTDPAGNTDFNLHENSDAASVAALGPGGTYGPFHSDDVSEPVSPVDNGVAGTQGQFRILCTVSHFGKDDPIIKPLQPGASHLHMFWGNTSTNAFTVADVPTSDAANDLFENGGSTCQGGVGNRSAYWMPAMMKGHGPSAEIVMPKTILLYYKSHRPYEIQLLPRGVQLLVGNVNAGGTVNSSFTNDVSLHWGCYNGSLSVNQQSVIPQNCSAGEEPRASVQFPQCMATSDNTRSGNPTLTDPDFVSHLFEQSQTVACPASHPYRMPQISYLVDWPSDEDTSDWYLSCDTIDDNGTPTNFADDTVANPGGCLHGDWLGGWNDDVQQSWIDGCFDPDTTAPHDNVGVNNFGGHRNCSIGQTGQNGTARRLKVISGSSLNGSLEYTGPTYIDDPAQ